MRHTPSTKLPAREHALKVVAELVKRLPADVWRGTHGIFLQACPSTCRDDTDRELKYHQEANFNYLTGAWDVASASVLITFSTDATDIRHTLFIPPADPLETMWSVAPPTLEDTAARFDSDAYLPTTELGTKLSEAAVDVLYTLPVTTDYPSLPSAVTSLLTTATHDAALLLPALHIARLTKTPAEVERIQIANAISSAAHGVLMAETGRSGVTRVRRAERTGHECAAEWEVEGEADAEALFVAACRRNGATDQAYLPIVASGTRASTLHYVCNDRLFPSTATSHAPGDTSFTPRRLARGCCGDVPDHAHATAPGARHTESFKPQVLLVDAGAEFEGYASDITRVIPIGNGGHFTDRAAEIYDIVLEMQKECEALVRPSAHWDTLHLRAHEVLIKNFLRLGIFVGGPSAHAQLVQSGLSAAFFPHGLGHSLGLDVHDSRQYLMSTHTDLPSSTKVTPEKLYTYLRIRQPLATGMVLTVEPGCYFATQLMDEHGVWESGLVDHEVLKRYLSVGGIRIEDAVVVTDTGCENLTTVVRDRAAVEAQCRAFL